MDPLPQYGPHAFIPYLPSSPSPHSLHPAAEPDLPPISLLNTSTWTYCGPVLSPSASHLPPSFHAWSSSTISGRLLPRLLPFLSFLQTFLHDAGAHHYWLTIRATQPTSEYDTVRWHTDDIFFDARGSKDRVGLQQQQNHQEQAPTTTTTPPPKLKPKLPRHGKPRTRYWKLATTLLGPATLFLPDNPLALAHLHRAKRAVLDATPHTCASLRCLSCLDAVDAVRTCLSRALEPYAPTSPRFGEAAFFRLGDADGAVHSEPRCHVDRIFVNVVPGSEPELRALMGRWGLGFPRAWCFGVPVGFDDIGGEEAVVKGRGTQRVDSAVEVEAEGGEECTGALGRDARDGTRARARVRGGAQRRESSTMSMNLRDEYAVWLEKKGFRFSEVFGVKRRSA